MKTMVSGPTEVHRHAFLPGPQVPGFSPSTPPRGPAPTLMGHCQWMGLIGAWVGRLGYLKDDRVVLHPTSQPNCSIIPNPTSQSIAL